VSPATSQQQAAIAARGNVLVAAGAGTGKTSTVTERCLQLVLREKCSIEEILMVTFTEAAAAEMRERIRQRLREAAGQTAPDSDPAHWLAEQIALLERAPISTLHSFCLGLVRRDFHALGLDPACVVLDDSQTKPLIHSVLHELFLRHYADDTSHAAAVRELVRTYGRGNDDDIRRLVVRIHHYTQTLANPAGWLAEQTALFSTESPDAWREEFVVAVREWKQEWRETIEPYAQDSKTVNACGQALDNIGANSGFEVIAGQIEAIVAADESKWDGLKKNFRDPIKGFFESAAFLFDLAKNNGAALAEDWHWSRKPMLTLLRLVQEFSAAFALAKRELGGIDFADQEQFALKLLVADDRQPSEVARTCRETFRFVFVDECQDINAAQDAILRAISREGNAANRFLVGDVKQSIYRFRLADPRIFQKYQAEWTALQSHSGQTLALTENFRSAEGLLGFINPLFRALMRPAVGGLTYGAAAELQFGNPAARAALSVQMDLSPRVRLHVLTKDDEATAGHEDSESLNPRTAELSDLPATEREALLIATELRQLKTSGYQIWDRQTDGFRAVEYSDMVVLLRATTGRTEVFAKAFHRAGVPLQAGRAGFLAAQEVTDVLNLLRLLDNPLQDLPLLAVLRSPFVGLSAEELVQLRMIERHGLLWNALLHSGKPGVHGTSELALKLEAFREQFQGWRELIRHSSLTQCIETALIETHYASLLLAGERGPERVANVRRLIDMARRFDPFQREGLFRFLQFIKEQEEAEVSHQPARTTHEAAVRVMTIHASKGLEFPVVVVAGLGGRFNLRDLSGDILLNEDIGLAPKILPPHTRSKYPSIAHWHAAQRERRFALGEELRLLYVAVTRARDALLLVGTASRKAEADRWQRPTPLTDHALLKANSYLDWLRLWFANATRVSDWQDGNAGANSLLSWRFHAVKVADETSGDPASDQDSGAPAIPTPKQIAEIRNRIARHYPHERAVREPAKTTVTALRRRLADETDDEAKKLLQPAISSQTFQTSRPGSTKLSAAAVGIAHHTFQQFVAIHRTATELDLRNEAERMREAGALTEEQFAALDFGALSGFWQSEIGAKLRKLPASVINREMPFTARISAKDLPALNSLSPASPLAEEDFVVVQGQVDLAVLLPDEIWLLDFKTDRVNADELPAKVTQYEPQLKIYALALARIYQRPVTQCWLHFLAAQTTVPLEPPACI
jgi:ATP-dependent helicase/nuclease subunit A